jgi:hypothetical protein
VIIHKPKWFLSLFKECAKIGKIWISHVQWLVLTDPACQQKYAAYWLGTSGIWFRYRTRDSKSIL